MGWIEHVGFPSEACGLKIFRPTIPETGLIVRRIFHSLVEAAINQENFRVAHRAIGIFEKHLQCLKGRQ